MSGTVLNVFYTVVFKTHIPRNLPRCDIARKWPNLASNPGQDSARAVPSPPDQAGDSFHLEVLSPVPNVIPIPGRTEPQQLVKLAHPGLCLVPKTAWQGRFWT